MVARMRSWNDGGEQVLRVCLLMVNHGERSQRSRQQDGFSEQIRLALARTLCHLVVSIALQTSVFLGKKKTSIRCVCVLNGLHFHSILSKKSLDHRKRFSNKKKNPSRHAIQYIQYPQLYFSLCPYHIGIRATVSILSAVIFYPSLFIHPKYTHPWLFIR